MLYRIKMISDEVEGFLREYKIDSDATFFQLHKAILDSCGYPDDQMTSFYLCDEEWKRGQQVTREDMGMGDSDEDIYVMEQTRLSELVSGEEQRMEYVFDPFGDRCFYLEVAEEIIGEQAPEPLLNRSRGEAPRQIEELDTDFTPQKGKNAAASTTGDFGDDLFGDDSSFDSDDFDPEGFEISEGKPY